MKDELVLITGAGRGIGRAIAEVFAASGYRLALVSRTAEEIEKVATSITQLDGDATPFVCDISNSSSVELLATEVNAKRGPVSILINNAGVAPSAKMEATTDELWNTTIATNLNAAFYLARAFVPGMKELKGGKILAIASTAALEGYAYTSAYVASKHGLLGLTRALAVELERSNIAVNAICPGFVRTKIVEEGIRNIMLRTGRSREEAEQDLARLNEGGKLIEPLEVAELALEVIEWKEFLTGKAVKMDRSFG